MENIKRRKMDDPDNNFRGHLAELMTGDTFGGGNCGRN